ncbi:MAG: 50S ribosomal protein L23 [Candidatus Micrarchaeota archaeon]|nr:50S ribosomal protein L23 [Candidatus Micrarchaeota archaeon]MDE1823829.1 50S ribosomal protein L23 [Candidatus Micrarchaeota archaeon]MDE1849481.1 50S ribosomal protein L23 [Candidatus Micrarchaeota archaeon]
MKALLYPLATEKALNVVDRENIISYVVDIRSKKNEIKKEFEGTFNVKVEKVRTAISIRNVKRAYIKLNKDYKASDIARRLKLV